MRILVIICAILFAIAGFLLWALISVTKDNNRLEKENKKKDEQAEKTAEKITEANKTKANARTGNHSVDFKYMADKLHDFSNK